MSAPRWEDLATRARGLATHLLDGATIAALARADGVAALATILRTQGYPLPEETSSVTADDLELAVRRQAASRLLVLAKWARARPAILDVLFEDEDRRSVRALIRGAVQGASAELRLAGIIPTPALPERALQELAEQASPGAIAVLLTAWGSPYGPALLREARATQPDLFAIESHLATTFARRATRNARAVGSALVLDHVRTAIDMENAMAALVLAAGAGDVSASDASVERAKTFVDGGHRLSLVAFLEAIAAGEPRATGRRLATVFRGTPLAGPFTHTEDLGDIEERLLRARIAMLHNAERRDPAGPASVLGFALRVRAEVCDVRRAIWGVVLGAPQSALVPA